MYKRQGLPSAAVGALVTLWLFRMDISIIAVIGILMLIGIVKKNAIMMIDFALEAQRTRGLAPAVAIHEACLLRFRPIMMTTSAALMGALPIALRLFQQQRGTEWGLVFAASVITVLPVIVVYVVFQRQIISGVTAGAVKG